MNELTLTIQIKIDPDMTQFPQRVSKKEYDVLTGEAIPKGTPAVAIKSRYGRRLQTWYVSPETYQKLIDEAGN